MPSPVTVHIFELLSDVHEIVHPESELSQLKSGFARLRKKMFLRGKLILLLLSSMHIQVKICKSLDLSLR